MGFLGNLFGRNGETAAERREWLETSVQAIGEAVLSRQIQHAHASRSFEAAETPAWVESWPSHAAPINDDLSRQLITMRSRARGLARNNEWAVGYLIKLDDNVLGANGITLQMRLKNADGSADDKTNALIEANWRKLCKKIDVSGLSFRAVESLALKALATDGEFMYMLRPHSGPMGFQIQLFQMDLLDVNLRRDYGGNRVRMGVEIDHDGKPVAYWLLAAKAGDTPSDFVSVGRHVRVSADKIRHCFLPSEIGQLRGYPWLAAGSQRLWMLSDFEKSAAVASSNAAKRQGFFYTPDGEAPTGFSDTIVSGVLDAAKAAGKVLSPDEIKAIVSAAEKYTTTMPGQYDTLPNGTQFISNDSKWPDISASGYAKDQVRGWSVARGASYVSLGNDLEAVNYSSAQVGIGDEREHYKSIQALLIGWLHTEVFDAALPYLIVNTPGLKFHEEDRYLDAATWQPRRWNAIDRVKESVANENNLRNKLTSRRRIILERGDDPEEIEAEIAEEAKLYGDVAAPSKTDTTTEATLKTAGLDANGDPLKGTENDH